MLLSGADSESDTGIWKYQDYRLFVRDRLADLKKSHPSFSARAFCKTAGFRSPGYLRRILQKDRNLGIEGIRRVARGLRLSDAEKDFFESLVRFTQAGEESEKDHYWRELSEKRKTAPARTLTSAQNYLFLRWYYVAILEMVRLGSDEKKNVLWLQNHIHPAVPEFKLRQAVEELKHMGLLNEDEEGCLSRAETMLALANDEKTPLGIMSSFHAQMSQLAVRAAMTHAPQEREFSSLTIALSEKGFQQVKQKLRELRNLLHTSLENAEHENDRRTVAAQINLQLFKLNRQ